MSTELEKQGQQFDQAQIDLIKRQVAPAGTTNDELSLFLQYAKRTGLDPFARQIYLSERRSKDQQTGNWTVSRKPEVTIDGFRLVAERTGRYAGQVGPFWCGEDGQWSDVWLSPLPPAAAKLGVLRADFKEPLWSVALYREYAQMTKDNGPNSMWKKYPSVMLAKCAESLALRRAFPRELSGLYTREEMPDERTEVKQVQVDVTQKRIKELSPAAEAISQELIKELGEEVDKPLPKDKKRPMLPFDILKNFRAVKDELHEITGNDTLYYAVLAQWNYKKSSEIPDAESAKTVFKGMLVTIKDAKMNKVNREEAEELAQKLGPTKFWAVAGSEGIDSDVWETLTGEPLVKFLAVLREVAI